MTRPGSLPTTDLWFEPCTIIGALAAADRVEVRGVQAERPSKSTMSMAIIGL